MTKIIDRIPANVSTDSYMAILKDLKDRHPEANLALRISHDPEYMLEIIDSDETFQETEDESLGSITLRKFVTEDEGLVAELALQGSEEYEEGMKFCAHTWYDALVRTGALNFVEIEFILENYAQPMKEEKFSVLIQRKDHETPVDQRNAARARVIELEDLLGDIQLYIKWAYVTHQLTTPQKELFADAVEARSARLNSDDPDHKMTVDRWWRE